MDIDNNVIRRCHNNRNVITRKIIGCKNSGIIHKTVKLTFRLVKEINLYQNELIFNHLQINEQEKISDISPFSAPYNGKFSSVIVINKNEQLPHRYIIITPDKTKVEHSGTRAPDIEQFNKSLNFNLKKIGEFKDSNTKELTIKYFEMDVSENVPEALMNIEPPKEHVSPASAFPNI